MGAVESFDLSATLIVHFKICLAICIALFEIVNREASNMEKAGNERLPVGVTELLSVSSYCRILILYYN